jgi:hypothetical protein
MGLPYMLLVFDWHGAGLPYVRLRTHQVDGTRSPGDYEQRVDHPRFVHACLLAIFHAALP